MRRFEITRIMSDVFIGSWGILSQSNLAGFPDGERVNHTMELFYVISGA